MAMARAFRLGRRVMGKRAPLGFCAKISLAVLLGLSFLLLLWSTFSPSSSSISSQRTIFSDISDQPSSSFLPTSAVAATTTVAAAESSENEKNKGSPATLLSSTVPKPENVKAAEKEEAESTQGEIGEEIEEPKSLEDQEPEAAVSAAAVSAAGSKVEEGGGGDGAEEYSEDGIDWDLEGGNSSQRKRNKKKLGPLFDSTARYNWKPCGGSGWQNYVPCLDTENLGGSVKLQRHRHRERSCPRTPATCLVPIPQGYQYPAPWPEREFKVFYRNVGHPKLSAFVKTRSWLSLNGDYLLFSKEKSEFKGGVSSYLELIEEMVPDIEWGKNVRVVLDIGCTDSSFGASLQEKNVLVLSLGQMNDETDLSQLALERGFPAMVGNLGSRRLPFPSGVFDAIHCSECNIRWHSNGGKLLLEMNRILRPGGYFIISAVHGDIDREEGMSALTASICWNIMADKIDEVNEVGINIYQRPASNGIYEIRRKKEPPFCKQDDDQDVAWYTSIKVCLHKVATSIEERGTDWPEEWPKRLDNFPEWLGESREKIIAEHEHWKAVVNKSYLNGLGIDWASIRNVMDMKAVFGGFAAALASEKIWVMNVVPAHGTNTLPIIFERGLLGVYHDWCEPFSTYPRTYDLLHADHLFSPQMNRCKQPVAIVVEMDRILRPGGWAIIRDRLEVLDPLQEILRSLHWDIRMTYSQGKEGLICAQKTTWRPLLP